MAYINIPDDLLSGPEVKELEDGIKEAARVKTQTGNMTLSRFMNIIKSACRWIWDKISGFIESIWEGLKSIFA